MPEQKELHCFKHNSLSIKSSIVAIGFFATIAIFLTISDHENARSLVLMLFMMTISLFSLFIKYAQLKVLVSDDAICYQTASDHWIAVKADIERMEWHRSDQGDVGVLFWKNNKTNFLKMSNLSKDDRIELTLHLRQRWSDVPQSEWESFFEKLRHSNFFPGLAFKLNESQKQP